MNNFERLLESSLEEGLFNRATAGKPKLKYKPQADGANKATVSPKRAAEKARIAAKRKANLATVATKRDPEQEKRIAAKREKAKKAGMGSKSKAPQQDYSKSSSKIIAKRKQIDAHNKVKVSGAGKRMLARAAA